MLKEAIERIEKLTTDSLAIVEKEIHGRKYLSSVMHLVEEPLEAPLEVHTLRGVLHYLQNNRDQLVLGDVLVHVENWGRVSVLGRTNASKKRPCHVAATPALADGFGQFVNRFTDVETFVVKVQQLFVDSDARAALLASVGNITVGAVNTFVDDGVTQEVTTKQGGALRAAALPNPVKLSPLRSFPEIVLDPVPYVLRARPKEGGAPELALFEADGGRWVLDATDKIAKFLLDNRGTNAAGESPPWGLIA